MNTKTSTYREKGRAVFLAAIMVLSVVAMGTAGFAGSAAAVVDDPSPTADDIDLTDGASPTQQITFTLENGTDYNDTGSEMSATTLNVTAADAGLNLSDVTIESAVINGGATDGSDGAGVNVTNVSTLASDDIIVNVDENAIAGDSNTIDITLTATYQAGNVASGVSFPIESDGGSLGSGDTSTDLTFDVLGLDITNVEPAGDQVIEQGNDILYNVTVENTGGNDAAGVEVDLDGNSDVNGTNVPNGSQVEFTGLNSSTSTIASGNSGEVNITTNSGGFAHDSVTNTVTARDSNNAFISGEITDKQNLGNIDSDVAERLEVTITEVSGNTNPDLEVVSSQPLSDFDTLADNNQYVDSASFIRGEPDQYTIELATFGQDSQYLFEVNDPEDQFSTFAGRTEVVDPGQNDDQAFRLTRNVDADRLTVENVDSTPAEIEETIQVTTKVETLDEVPVGDYSDFDGESITASVAAADFDSPNGLGLDESNVVIEGTPQPSSNTSDDNGLANFEIGLDLGGNAPEDFDQNIEATITFEADSNSSTTATQTVVFQPDPRGTGSISGTVQNINPDFDLGVESNLEDASGIPVHAVRLDTVDTNTDTIPDDRPVEAGDQYRVVTFDSGEVQAVQDVRTDYLVTTNESEVTQNRTTAGFDVDQTSDNGFDDIDLHFLRPDDYQVQSYDSAADTWNNVSTADNAGDADAQFEATEDLRYDAIEQRYDEASAVVTDTTNENGDFSLFELPTDPDGGVDYVVIAGEGYDTGDDQTELGFANFAGFDVVNVEPNADAGAEQNSVGLQVQEFSPDRTVEYRIDVTANESKYEAVATGESTPVEISVESKLLEEDDSEFDAASNVDLTLELQQLAQEPLTDTMGELNSTSVTTNDEGVATTTFDAFPSAQANTGNLNVSAALAEANSDGDTFETTNGEQATIEVFDAGEITGDVVDEQNNNFGGPEENRATVRLFNQNDLNNPIAETTTGPEGSYTFSDVRTGNKYRVVASFNDATGFSNVGGNNGLDSGTTNADVVITDIEAPEGFDVSSLVPQDGTVAQGEPLDVTADISNIAGSQDSQEVTFSITNESGDVVFSDSQQVTLEAGQTETVTFSLSFGDTASLEAGDYTHSVSTEVGQDAEGSLTVEAFGSSAVEAYANNEGSVGDSEVFAAVQDWQNNDGYFAQADDPDAAIFEIVQAWQDN